MSIYVSIGIPAGQIENSERKYIIHKDGLFGIPELGYQLWTFFFHGATVEEAMAQYANIDEKEKEIIATCLYELIDNGFLVPLKEIVKCVPVRQGMGLGLTDNSTHYTVICDEPIYMSYLSYAIWCYANNNYSTKEISQIMKKQGIRFSNKEFMEALFHLIKTDALAFA